MDKEHLLEMAGNPDLIPGIYNYCNRWSERCAFTSRCLQFKMQNEEEHDLESLSPDEDNARFWDRVSESLSLAMEMIRDYAEREGIDPDASSTIPCSPGPICWRTFRKNMMRYSKSSHIS